MSRGGEEKFAQAISLLPSKQFVFAQKQIAVRKMHYRMHFSHYSSFLQILIEALMQALLR